mmetsp:Transcript_15174/g.41747  ORF Transcript_15174/g.41747 Transcript_15174/m.41747 type:complete len:102 (-) Transcript_15174:295-600(-)
MHENMLVRVFSARDYETHGNDGAVLQVTSKDLDGHTMLVVRPQVVRSTKKTRDEEKNSGGGPPSPSGSSNSRTSTKTTRGGASRRADRVRSQPSAKEGKAR